MNILLTGASSFTGFWFANRLKDAGHQVVAALRGSPAGYSGVRAERAAWLGRWAEVAPDCAFGGPAFLDLIGSRRFDVLCHHAAEVSDYRSPDFDVAGAVAANTFNLRRVLTTLRQRGLKAVVATGSVFEADEGSGPAPRRAFSPYGLSKGLSYEVLRYWGEALGVPVSKFVIANPFGPFEEARFVAHAVGVWTKGEAVEVRTPNYLRDNIPVDLLALAYARFVGEAGAGAPGRRLGPCGYMESQGAFAQRLARELGPRLGFEARVVLAEQKDFDEPLARLNTDVIDPAALGWSETKAWDALAGYYRGKGFVGSARPSAVAPPPAAPAPCDLFGAVDVVDFLQVSGWLTDKLGDNPRFVRVKVDGVEQGTARADSLRRDLANLKVSDGYSGYRFAFSKPFDPFRDHVVELEDRDADRPFGPPRQLKKLVGGPDSPFAADRDFLAANVSTANYESDHIAIYLDLHGRAVGLGLPKSDDAEIELVRKTSVAHPYYDALGVGLERLELKLRPRAGVAAVAFGYPELSAEDRALCANLIPAGVPDYLKDIAAENMTRVSGDGERIGRFAATGLATAHRIDQLVRLHFGRGVADCGACLDWGAGPGRVALPMTRILAPGLKMTATDVDGYNVAFGKAHFPDLEFVESPFLPPLPYPDHTFGAIYAVSVFTHLTESAQFAWLAELRRVAKPGAAVVVSVHNEYAAAEGAMVDSRIANEIANRGFSDIFYDSNLGPKLKEKSYYRATFHLWRYILENWTRDFDILKIHTSGHGLTQDFVVMRPK